MRTIVAFSCLAAVAAAQSSPAEIAQIETLEKGLGAKPDSAGARNQILQLLTDPNVTANLPVERVIETRRRHILWLIATHPEQRNNFLRASQLIPLRGPWADPEGYADSVRMWKERASRPGASAGVLASAAVYLKASDRPAALALLRAGLQDHPEDGALWRAVGMVDAAAMAGVTGPGDRDQFAADPTLGDAPLAKLARKEVESSANAFLLGGAAQMLGGNLIQNQGQLHFGDDDASSLAERWLRRAIELAPAEAEWKALLVPVLRLQASRSEDPRERARLLREAMGFLPQRDTPTALTELAKAEFESGDDEAARRDAQRAVEGAVDVAKRNPQQAATLINRGNSVLGRIALAHGDLAQARERLRASLRFAAPASVNFGVAGPDLSLAEDLADAGERDAVIEYLEASRQFWPYDRGLAGHYIRSIQAGKKREAFANFAHASAEIVNRPAPAFHLHDPGGQEWTLPSLAGKPSALLFWNAACQSCAGQIAEFAKASAGTDLRLLAVNVGDSRAAVAAFIDKNHVGATVLEGGGAIAAAYRVDTYPSLAVIDAHGRITQYQVGAMARPGQTVEAALRSRIATPVALEAMQGESGSTLSWMPVPGAQSYVVEWEARDQTGWPSDRDGFLHVVPTRDTQVRVECSGAMRWRVFAVGSGVAGEATAWQTPRHLQ